ncbi:hypothetical protein KIPB_001743 [Kipferlia bialata]|uniref:Palmitoyltransferase n=1 Tax=Kipferlia bialata TaxID=797122 RepID=A0A9K3CR14_9EUKA|nr:hypothetical protein KIPB_001743 [Kipferlia bialata]|eukprot:g1743.t1
MREIITPRGQTDSAKRIRRHGFQLPYNPAQLLATIVIVVCPVVWVLFVSPAFSPSIRYLVGGAAALLGVLSMLFAVLTMLRDPADAVCYASRAEMPALYADEPDRSYYCDTCLMRVASSTKHCRVCNKCVKGFDHHCVWLNTCVGQANHSLFFVFISVTVVLLLHLLICTGVALYAYSQDSLPDAFSVTTSVFLCVSIGSLVVDLVALALVGQLLLFHIRLAVLHVSTYEYVTRVKGETKDRTHKRAVAKYPCLPLGAAACLVTTGDIVKCKACAKTTTVEAVGSEEVRVELPEVVQEKQTQPSSTLSRRDSASESGRESGRESAGGRPRSNSRLSKLSARFAPRGSSGSLGSLGDFQGRPGSMDSIDAVTAQYNRRTSILAGRRGSLARRGSMSHANMSNGSLGALSGSFGGSGVQLPPIQAPDWLTQASSKAMPSTTSALGRETPAFVDQLVSATDVDQGGQGAGSGLPDFSHPDGVVMASRENSERSDTESSSSDEEGGVYVYNPDRSASVDSESGSGSGSETETEDSESYTYATDGTTTDSEETQGGRGADTGLIV